jgi:hypothetical protein
MAAHPTIEVREGPNVWRLLRTDRDGASEGQIPQMAAAAVRWFVRGVGPAGAERGPLHELVSTGPNEWRFGWVRPLRVLSVTQSEPSNMPVGTLLADRNRTVPDTIPTVRGQKPWWVVVQFWWRAPNATIEYPALREGIFGRSYELNGADWVLDQAVAPQRSPDPGGQTWDEAQGANASAAVKSAGESLGKVVAGGFGLGILALLYLLSRKV